MEKIKLKAHRAVKKAIKSGNFVDLKEKFVRCVDCGKRATVYDHRDYEKPLDVAPVCVSCNSKRGAGRTPGNEGIIKLCVICGSVIKAKNKSRIPKKNAITCSGSCRVIRWAQKKKKTLIGS